MSAVIVWKEKTVARPWLVISRESRVRVVYLRSTVLAVVVRYAGSLSDILTLLRRAVHGEALGVHADLCERRARIHRSCAVLILELHRRLICKP